MPYFDQSLNAVNKTHTDQYSIFRMLIDIRYAAMFSTYRAA